MTTLFWHAVFMSDKPIIELEDYWPYQVIVLADLVSRHTHSILKDHGSMNISQWRVLAAIGEKAGRSAAEVVAVTPMDKGIVSRATASLVEDGLVSKKGDPDDRRRSELFLTAKGKRQYQAIATALTEAMKSLDVPDRLNAVLLTQIESMKALLQNTER